MAFTNKDVMDLRQKTGAGIMDCKKALTETDGNMDKAVDWLREKGMATAAKKSTRIAAEGAVGSYIHMGGKIGVLVELNCESDFVAKSEGFQELVKNVAMQIAAANPQYLTEADVPAEVIEKEKEIYKTQIAQDEKLSKKPPQAIEKIIEGKISKFLKEVCLMDQLYIKDDSKTISQLLTEAVAKNGEKITIRRFVRFEMGEGLEKKQDNFVDEINQQMAKMNI